MTFAKLGATALTIATLAAGAASAGGWTLNGETSRLAFGSIKQSEIGEAHVFQSIDGTVSDAGAVEIGIDLASVETLIDIRNERMVEHVFKNVARATIDAQIDLAAMEALEVGASSVLEVEGDLTLLGTEVPLYGDVFVMRLAEDKVMVTTDSMIFLSTADAGIDAGIDKLQELASLDDITRAVPVTFRLMFTAGGASG